MALAERRPLVIVTPEHAGRIASAFVGTVELADKIEREIRALPYGQQRSSKRDTESGLLDEVLARLSAVPSVLVEPAYNSVVATPLIVELRETAARAVALDAVVCALASDAWRLDAFSLVGWVESPVAKAISPAGLLRRG